MLYEPIINDDFEYWRAWELLFHDPILYTWMYWQTVDARDSLRKPFRLHFTDEPLFQDTLWRASWGFNTRNDGAWSSFVVPPH